MLRALYTAATGMEAQQTKMDTISHNLANANTAGFKKSRVEFEDLLSETVRGAGVPTAQGGTEPTALQVGLGVRASGTTRTFSQGDMMNTQNPFDIAIEGPGFLRVMRPNGDIAFTRAGNLRTDSTGRLVTQKGELIDPPITVPPDATQVNIRADGSIEARAAGRPEPIPLGSLELTLFVNPTGLESIGGNLMIATPAAGQMMQVRPGEMGAGAIAQGFLESSNVKAVEEMIDMITTQRAYELNSKVIQSADQMLQKLTNLR